MKARTHSLPKAHFNKIEEEVIFLKAITEFINEMVNYEIVKLLGNDPHSQIAFNSMTHQKYFNIILLDFLSCSDPEVLGRKSPYLAALRKICEHPSFKKGNPIDTLRSSTTAFVDWLEKETTVEKIWLPSIDLETNLSIKRIEFIKICGNISKHNFSRLSGVAHNLIHVFKRNKIKLSPENSLLIFGEFYEWFHTHIFNYHSSAIAEFLNNIRWGIYEYLHPEFQKSIVYEGDEQPRMYRYTYPHEITNNFAKNCYWNLMNEVRSPPYMRKFQVTRYLKMRY